MKGDWFFPRLVREFCNNNQTTMISPAYFFYIYPQQYFYIAQRLVGQPKCHLIETLQLEESQLVGSEPVMNWL